MTETTTVEQDDWAGYALSEGEYVATVAKIAKISERAAKRGFTGSLSVEATREERQEKDALTGLTATKIVYLTKVVGTAPSYGGWTFLARIDRIPGSDQFTTAAAPGVEGVDREGIVPGVCDHCGHDRRRNNTYLVRNDETGEQRQVGSTCIKDFLGWSATVVFFGDSDVSVEEGGSHVEWTFTTDTVLAYAYAAIRAFGWVPSSASAGGQSTAQWVRVALGIYRPNKWEQQELPRLRQYADEATEKAATVRAFVLSDEFNGTSDYVANLKVSMHVDVIGLKQIGIIASAPQAYIRHLENAAGREARQAQHEVTKAQSDFLAPVGTKKVRVEGAISAVRFIEGDYGTTVLYTILTKEGNVVKWFASREALGTHEGREVVIEGTVKKHDEYQGVKSTVLTRCKEVQ